jgi:hypothetical protein
MFCRVPAVGLLVAGALLASPATAETRKPPISENAKRPPQPKTHITVQQRSFLDAGTEVKPGQRKFMDYAFPPGYSPTAPIDYTSGNIYGPHGGLLNPYGFGAW